MRRTLLTEQQLLDYLREQGVLFNTEKDFTDYLAVYADWYAIAESFGITYRQIVRWYKETFLRRRHGQLTDQDREFIKDQMANRVACHQPLDSEFRNYLRQNLSDSYNESAFMTFFYNCKSKISRCSFKQTQLPFEFIVFEQE